MSMRWHQRQASEPPWLWVEPLEPRVLLSVSLTSGMLTVTGSALADDIRLSAGDNPGQIIVMGDPDAQDGLTQRGEPDSSQHP